MTAKTATLKSYKDPFLQFIYNLQDEICKALVSEDPDCMITEDVWERPEGGGGRSRAIGKGSVFENGGVNISTVHGQLPSSMMQYLETQHRNFFACGISLIIHPLNPFVPTVHANYRYFELYDADGLLIDQWFGGGSDITPYYLYKDDVAYFHKTNFEVCNRFDAILYPRFKKNCDEYFFNHHRGEARGAGGLFFDRLRGDESRDAEFWYAFVTSCGQAFVDSYLPIVRKRKSEPYTDQHKYLAGDPPGQVCGIQPDPRQGYPLRTENQRPCGIDTDEPAGQGKVGIQLPAGTRQPGSGAAGNSENPGKLDLKMNGTAIFSARTFLPLYR
jgi:coproporphyrinogen III oxidase